MPCHGCNRDELAAALLHLFNIGDLIARRWDEWDPVGDYFSPALHEIEAGLEGKEQIIYFLTAQGGSRWESLSQANWPQYVSEKSATDIKSLESKFSSGKVENFRMFQSVNQDSIRQLINAYTSQGEIIPSTERWDVLTPWKPTYWKEFPVGHRLICEFNSTFEGDTGKCPDLPLRIWYTVPTFEDAKTLP